MTEKGKGYYSFIFSESERLSRLIQNVLQLSKLSRGENEVQIESVAVGELFSRAVEKVRTQVESAEFVLVEERDESVSDRLVDVDEDAFMQIIINLVDNAVKFSKDAERKEVVLGYGKRGDEVAFSVRDFGPGIPEAQLRHIFKLFYRGESELTRTTQGTGIGLALVNELATSMHARLDVTTTPGTTFRLLLP